MDRDKRLAANRARNRKWRQEQPQKYLWNHARCRARRKKLLFLITPLDIPLPEFCPVFGMRLAYGTVTRAARDCAASLDRINPRLGYVPGNIRVVSFRANYLMADGMIEEFEQIVAFLKA